jgi:monoterpene epsilon-lactone hydrolase
MAIGRIVVRLRKRRGQRASYEQLKRENRPDPPRGIARRHDVGVDDANGVRAVWLDRERAARGTIVHLHGGSYISGPVKEHWDWLSRLAQATGTAAVMVDYPLTPEHSYPEALDRTLAFAETLAGPWVLAGDSAGGGLAVGAAYRIRDGGGRPPGALVLISPWLDVTMSNPEARGNEDVDPMLSLIGLARGAQPYAGDHDPRDPHISPLFGDPSGLPPMLVHVGTRELFLWDNRLWAERCRAAGVECELVECEGGFHNYPIAVALVPEARDALRRQAAFVKRRL